MFRIVHSRANRSPFMIDVYANFDWERINPITDPDVLPDGGHFYFEGNKELELATMDMFEFGYRVKPVKFIQADFEVFHTRMKNFDSFVMDSINVAVGSAIDQLHLKDSVLPTYGLFRYQNLDVESHQTGITANISIVITENLYIKLHGTVQQTKLRNVDHTLTVNDKMQYMATYAVVAFQTSGTGLRYDSVQFASGYYDKYTLGSNAKDKEIISLYQSSTLM